MPSAHGRDRSKQYEAIGRAVWTYYRRRALALVALEVKEGRLPRLFTTPTPCHEACGRRALVWEHRDYMRPLSVVPSCDPCNQRRGPAELGPEHVIDAIRRALRQHPK